MMFAHMQTSTNILQTLDGKQKFDRFMRSLGIHVKSYRADNGVFATKDHSKHQTQRSKYYL